MKSVIEPKSVWQDRPHWLLLLNGLAMIPVLIVWPLTIETSLFTLGLSTVMALNYLYFILTIIHPVLFAGWVYLNLRLFKPSKILSILLTLLLYVFHAWWIPVAFAFFW